jgi:hypothetical protein
MERLIRERERVGQQCKADVERESKKERHDALYYLFLLLYVRSCERVSQSQKRLERSRFCQSPEPSFCIYSCVHLVCVVILLFYTHCLVSYIILREMEEWINGCHITASTFSSHCFFGWSRPSGHTHST